MTFFLLHRLFFEKKGCYEKLVYKYTFSYYDPLYHTTTSKSTPIALKCNKTTLIVLAKDLLISANREEELVKGMFLKQFNLKCIVTNTVHAR